MRPCPFLGKFDDESTPILFPSPWNRCYRPSKVITPIAEHQDHRCLGEFELCPAFVNKSDIKKVPSEKKNFQRQRRSPLAVASLIALAVFLLAVMALLIGQYYFGFQWKKITQKGLEPIPTATLVWQATATPATEPSLTVIIPVTGIPTPLSVTITPSVAVPLPKVGLETPFGDELQFMIHKLQGGDNFITLSEQYMTNIDVIKWVNHNLYIPLQKDSLIIVPINQIFVDPNLPVFEVYQVLAYQIRVEELASSMDVNLDQLCYYNNIKADQVLPYGYWLIIPRDRK